jgi:hypothetical protein
MIFLMRIISVSRRTDIPAFYADWFMERVSAGFAGYVNPFGGQKYLVSLKPADVACFVFWSKNFAPFLEHLFTIKKLGYRACFNYTITGLPALYESNCIPVNNSVLALKQLAGLFSPEAINWRYDPVVISGETDFAFHLKNFTRLTEQLKGFVQRCFISYLTPYTKVLRNLERFESTHNIHISSPGIAEKKQFALKLAEIAAAAGISLYSCSGDYLLADTIHKGHCIDGALIKELYYPHGFKYKPKPTREECGCTESTDIGMYDTCVHGCVYCYANANQATAAANFRRHEHAAAFLGFTKAQSDAWLQELAPNQTVCQPGLFG